MSNDTQTPNVNIGEQNVPENLAEQSGLPNMSSTKVFKVETDMLVLGDVYADNFIGRGAAGGTYATQVGFNPEDPLDVASVVLDAGTDGTDGQLTITNITSDGTVDFTGATLIGISAGGIDLNDLSVSVDAAGTANLAYNDLTGVFTYTPPDLSSYLTANSTDTLTNKSGSNSQWTNDEGYTTNVGTVTPSSTDVFTNKSGSNSQWTNDEGYTTNVGDITEVVAGTGLTGGATSGSATLDIDSTVVTLTGAQTLTDKTLTSPALTTPTIEGGTSDWQFSVSGDDLIISYGGVSKAKLTTTGDLVVTGNLTAFGTI